MEVFLKSLTARMNEQVKRTMAVFTKRVGLARDAIASMLKMIENDDKTIRMDLKHLELTRHNLYMNNYKPVTMKTLRNKKVQVQELFQRQVKISDNMRFALPGDKNRVQFERKQKMDGYFRWGLSGYLSVNQISKLRVRIVQQTTTFPWNNWSNIHIALVGQSVDPETVP